MPNQQSTLTPEERDNLIAEFAKMIEHPTCRITISTGVHYRNNDATGYVEGEPTNGRTITIEINGGAREIRD